MARVNPGATNVITSGEPFTWGLMEHSDASQKEILTNLKGHTHRFRLTHSHRRQGLLPSDPRNVTIITFKCKPTKTRRYFGASRQIFLLSGNCTDSVESCQLARLRSAAVEGGWGSCNSPGWGQTMKYNQPKENDWPDVISISEKKKNSPKGTDKHHRISSSTYISLPFIPKCRFCSTVVWGFIYIPLINRLRPNPRILSLPDHRSNSGKNKKHPINNLDPKGNSWWLITCYLTRDFVRLTAPDENNKFAYFDQSSFPLLPIMCSVDYESGWFVSRKGTISSPNPLYRYWDTNINYVFFLSP